MNSKRSNGILSRSQITSRMLDDMCCAVCCALCYATPTIRHMNATTFDAVDDR